MDSSSIVSIADSLISNGEATTPRLDTVSYYDDSEPNWNERPYFTKIEERRGRSGIHIDVSAKNAFSFGYDLDRFAASPGSEKCTSKAINDFTQTVLQQGNRVLLSGIGGDEVLGGVPTPLPELADLLAKVHLPTFAAQALEWALTSRTPIPHLVWETSRLFLPQRSKTAWEKHRLPRWVEPTFADRHRRAFDSYRQRIRLFGPLPSFQENLSTLGTLRRQLGISTPPSKPLFDKTYPYLDRDLLAFLYAIPREQLVRPHQRRSLMRRALSGIVPDEILQRKRKAFVSRTPAILAHRTWNELTGAGQPLLSDDLGIIDSTLLARELEEIRDGRAAGIGPALRILEIESWLRHLAKLGMLATAAAAPDGQWITGLSKP